METVKCDNCGEKLKKYPSEVSQHNFCDLDCCNEWQSEERDYSFQENSVNLECEKCGDEYKVPKHKEEDSRFCSRQCQNEVISQKEHNTTECDYCGNETKKPAYLIEESEHNFCNSKCKGEWMSKNNTKENHPNWKGADRQKENYYGKNWPEKRQRVIERDQKCQRCGNPEAKDVHHKKKFREFESKEKANKLSNLELLCRNCHMEAEYEKNTPFQHQEFEVDFNFGIMSFIFDKDIAIAHDKVQRQIDAMPKQNLALGGIEKAMAKTFTTIEALNIQAKRERTRERNTP